MTNSEEIVSRIRENRTKFDQFNKQRLEKLYDSMANQKLVDLVEALPFLLTTNQPSLPGYISSSAVVSGLHNYVPSGKGHEFHSE